VEASLIESAIYVEEAGTGNAREKKCFSDHDGEEAGSARTWVSDPDGEVENAISLVSGHGGGAGAMENGRAMTSTSGGVWEGRKIGMKIEKEIEKPDVGAAAYVIVSEIANESARNMMSRTIRCSSLNLIRPLEPG
jgi:hypothetical protein